MWCINHTLAHKMTQALMNMEINVSQPQFNIIQPFTSSTLALTHRVKTVKDFSFDEGNIIDVCNNLVVVFVSLHPQDIQSICNNLRQTRAVTNPPRRLQECKLLLLFGAAP